MNFTENLVSIKDLSLLDYLQLMISTGKNKNIIINKNKKMGVIIIKNRKIIFAIDYLGNRGEFAFNNICSWEYSIFREINIEGEINTNIEIDADTLLKKTQDTCKQEDKTDYIDNLDEISFDCKNQQINKLFIKNKIKYSSIEAENKIIKNIINELIVDYNIETLAILEMSEENNENKIIALHSCELIDYCDLYSEIFSSISQTILNKKFNLNLTQYQLTLENNKIMIAERFEDTNYLIALEIDTSKISTGIIVNVFLPLIKEELIKILIH